MKPAEVFATKYAQLNPEQKRAVDTIEGPVLVVAGPGTGKTQVLAMRIANILQNDMDVDASNILCLTFTESGVGAMRKRLQSIIGSLAYHVNIYTFHGFCNDVIQTYPEKFPKLNGSPRQLDDLSRIKVIRQILDELPSEKKYHLRLFANPYQHQYEIITSIQTLKREGVSAGEFAEVVSEQLSELEAYPDLNAKTGKPKQKYAQQLKTAERNVELAEIYAAYEQVLQDENLYDYEDMILFVINAFEDDWDLVQHYRERFQYIHVDEYQDTNGSQNKLIKLLGSEHPENRPNIFAVGDDDQAIYRFQGANVDNLLFFEQQFAGVQTVAITTNYRSNQAILDFAKDSIGHNQNRLVNIISGLSKDLKSGRALKPIKPTVAQLETGEDELEYVVTKINELVAGGANYEDIAILYRRHSDAEDIIDALLRSHIPLKLATGGNALEEQSVQMLLNLLKLIQFKVSERDSILFEALFYTFLQKQFAFSRLEVFKLLAYVNDHNHFVRDPKAKIGLFSVMGDVNKLAEAGIEDSTGFVSFYQKIVAWKELEANTNLVDFVAHILQESGLFAKVFGKELDIDEANAVNSFFQFVKAQYQADRQLNLVRFLEDLNLLAENNLSIGEKSMELQHDSVNLMTAHASKGLEYSNVFIVKAFHRNWGGRVSRQIIKLPPELLTLVEVPSDREQKKELETEDERRLFFVAATRAQQRLFVTFANEYGDPKNKKEVEASQFVTELATEVFEPVSAENAITTSQESRLRKSVAPLIKIDIGEQEREFLGALVRKFRLSASALNEYLECPLKFKFNRLLKAPIPSSPHIALGNAVHKALEKQGRQLMKGKALSKSELMQDFETALETELLSGEDYELTLTEGLHILDGYFEEYKDSWPVPAAVEYNFSKHNVILEFTDQEPVVLSGKIDKLEWVDEATSRIKIIDYKTSNPKTENEIRGLTKSSDKNIWRQLVFYVLMAQLDDRFKHPSKMQKYLVDHVEVDFLKAKNGKRVRRAITIVQEDVVELKQEIDVAMKSIRNLEFYGESDYELCGECDYCKLMQMV